MPWPTWNRFTNPNGLTASQLEATLRKTRTLRRLFHPGSKAKEKTVLGLLRLAGQKNVSGHVIRHRPFPGSAHSNAILTAAWEQALEAAPALLSAALRDLYHPTEGPSDPRFRLDYNGKDLSHGINTSDET